MLKRIDLKQVAKSIQKPQANDQLTFAELSRAWLAVTRNGDDVLRMRKWNDLFGDRIAWTITTDELIGIGQGMLEHGYAPGSVNRDIGAIGSMFKWIIGQRRAPAGFVSPTLNFRRYAEPIRIVEVADEEIQRLRDISRANGNKHFTIFVHLLIDTGARKSELLERTWAEFDLEKRRIYLTSDATKTGKARALYFSQDTAALIKRLIPRRPDGMLAFPGRATQLPANYRKSWLVLTEAAGVPKLRMHDIRHHRASELLVKGTPLPVAAQIMGHGSQVLERRYGHLSVSDKQAAAEAAWAA